MIKDLLEEKAKGNFDKALELFMRGAQQNTIEDSPFDEYGRYKKITLYKDCAIKYSLSTSLED